MTIGIGCCGTRAGLAVLKALETAEKVCTGAVGGYAVFAAITKTGDIIRAETQRGGVKKLFAEVPFEVIEAPFAAVISSNPDRPEPLSQFVAADVNLGLVTGHRFPQVKNKEGVPLNAAVLERLRDKSAQEAVSSVLKENPNADAGLMAVSIKNEIGFGNSVRVSRRYDAGSSYRYDEKTHTCVAILHNAIFPKEGIAITMTDVAMTVMAEEVSSSFFTVRQGVRLELGEINAVIIDSNNVAQKVITTDAQILTGHHDCAAIYLDALVLRDDKEIGRVWLEPYTVVKEGKILSLDGQAELKVGFRKSI